MALDTCGIEEELVEGVAPELQPQVGLHEEVVVVDVVIGVVVWTVQREFLKWSNYKKISNFNRCDNKCSSKSCIALYLNY
jgi:hypothetical protein